MRHSHGCNGIHRGLLDSTDADTGDSRVGGLPCECKARQERPWKTDGRFRLSVVAISAFGWLVACLLPSGAGRLRSPVAAATEGKPGRYGELSCPAHAESARSDEPATSPCHQ